MIKWDCTDEAYRLIERITERARLIHWEGCSTYNEHCDTWDGQGVKMALLACHCNGCGLELPALLDTDRATLVHDVFGIARHIDTETGQLDPAVFWPRLAAQQ